MAAREYPRHTKHLLRMGLLAHFRLSFVVPQILPYTHTYTLDCACHTGTYQRVVHGRTNTHTPTRMDMRKYVYERHKLLYTII